jgi:hypothetical protein
MITESPRIVRYCGVKSNRSRMKLLGCGFAHLNRLASIRYLTLSRDGSEISKVAIFEKS